MSNRAVLRLAVVGFLGVFSTAGCSFWGSAGGGPVEKDTAYRLLGRAPWKTSDRGYKAILEGSFQAVPWGTVATESYGISIGKATFRQSSRRSWGSFPIIGWAPGETNIMLDKGEKKTERIVGQSVLWLPGLPFAALWAHASDMWFSLDRGEELASRLYWGAGPAGVIAGYTRCVQPSDIPQLYGSMLSAGTGTFGRNLAAVAVTKGDDARYNSQWGWHILGGVIGWGRVNYEYVLQIAWLPIPLWHIRE